MRTAALERSHRGDPGAGRPGPGRRARPRSPPAWPSSTTCCMQLARHGGLGLEVEATGDLEVDGHHLVEDVGLCLGEALKAALGDRAGIARFGEAHVPLDESLARVVVDLSGPPLVPLRRQAAGPDPGQRLPPGAGPGVLHRLLPARRLRPARHHPLRREHAPPAGGPVQGPGRGPQARPEAGGGRHPLHQGHPHQLRSTHDHPHRLRRRQPALPAGRPQAPGLPERARRDPRRRGPEPAPWSCPAWATSPRPGRPWWSAAGGTCCRPWPGRPARCWASAWACSCWPKAARRARRPRPGPGAGRVPAAGARGQGAQHGLGQGRPGPWIPPGPAGFPGGLAATSCTATPWIRTRDRPGIHPRPALRGHAGPGPGAGLPGPPGEVRGLRRKSAAGRAGLDGGDAMRLIPSMDLLGGQVVRLLKGERASAYVYPVTPEAWVQRLVEAGARRIHLVDLDAAFGGAPQARAAGLRQGLAPGGLPAGRRPALPRRGGAGPGGRLRGGGGHPGPGARRRRCGAWTLPGSSPPWTCARARRWCAAGPRPPALTLEAVAAPAAGPGHPAGPGHRRGAGRGHGRARAGGPGPGGRPGLPGAGLRRPARPGRPGPDRRGAGGGVPPFPARPCWMGRMTPEDPAVRAAMAAPEGAN